MPHVSASVLGLRREGSPAWLARAAFVAAFKAQDAGESVAAAVLFRASAYIYEAPPFSHAHTAGHEAGVALALVNW